MTISGILLIMIAVVATNTASRRHLVQLPRRQRRRLPPGRRNSIHRVNQFQWPYEEIETHARERKSGLSSFSLLVDNFFTLETLKFFLGQNHLFFFSVVYHVDRTYCCFRVLYGTPKAIAKYLRGNKLHQPLEEEPDK